MIIHNFYDEWTVFLKDRFVLGENYDKTEKQLRRRNTVPFAFSFEIQQNHSFKFLQNIANTQFPKEADNITSLTSFYFSKKRIDYIRVHDVKKTAEAINFGSLLQ